MRYFLIQNCELFFKVILCVFLSGLIGFNREKNGMTVGVRTHILVGLCAVLLQVTAMDYSVKYDSAGDVFRLGGQMISGIGFLGAGAIIKGSKHVRGLTTAASLFFVACVGLSIGSGMYIPSIVIALTGYAFLVDLFRLKKIVSTNKSLTVSLSLDISGTYANSANLITESLSDLDAEIESIDVLTMSTDKSSIAMKIKTGDETNINEIVDSLMSVASVKRTEVLKKY